jgi:hypothetical protein
MDRRSLRRNIPPAAISRRPIPAARRIPSMFAALTQDYKFLTLAVVNATECEQHFDLTVTGAHLDSPSTLSQMTGKDLDSAETPSGLTDSARNTSCLRISEFISQFR